MNEIYEVAQFLSIHDFIVKLEKGYDTIAKLSGGQKQKIALARAIIRKPKVLILDESTSALDSISEENILKIIDRLIKEYKMTVITIAHRQSTIDKCDRIVSITKSV
jgi:ABC-type multidrug transport system fused ATPase/permease subunit